MLQGGETLMKKTSAVSICAILVLGLAAIASANQLAAVDPAEGWLQVANGYWQRTTEDGRLQTIAQGREALEMVLADLNARMVELVDLYLSNPTEEMKQALDAHTRIIASVERGIASSAAKATIPAGWCTVDWDANAGGANPCINYANAMSLYEGSSPGDCFGLCDLYAYSYVDRELCDGRIVSSSSSCYHPDTINRTCNVSESLSDGPARRCYASAYASISCPDVGYYQSDDAYSYSCGFLCPVCPIKDVE
jgi:hypothetical protein